MKKVENNINNLSIIDVSNDMLQTATFLAKQRIIFEYPRAGYGTYSQENHLINLQYGYIGELSFLKFITEHLNNKYSSLNPNERFQNLKNKKFSYNLIIGQTDDGFDFQVKNNEIDIKTYGTKLLSSINDIFRYNLLIDKRQAKNHQADIYIQVFIIGNNKPEKCVLAGFYEGLPSLNSRFPQPAHAIPVPQLFTMDEFLEKFF